MLHTKSDFNNNYHNNNINNNNNNNNDNNNNQKEKINCQTNERCWGQTFFEVSSTVPCQCGL